MIPMFVAKSDMKSAARVGACLGIKVRNLGVSQDQKAVWSLEDDDLIFITLEFGPHYLAEGVAPKVSVGSSKKCDITADVSKVFRLWWTIEERIKNKLLPNHKWPPNDLVDLWKDDKPPKCSSIKELMDQSTQNFETCLQALKKWETKKFQNFSQKLLRIC